jgi:TPP-dependent pyruvate/acetoin dehydrogenase alpha subunit
MVIKKSTLKEIYYLMKRCRAFEERAIVELRKGMPGFIHSSIGAEAIPCGITPFLSPDDYILTTHRGHSDIIARGAGFKATMSELYAKETGYCKGVSGSMHIAALDLNILGATGIVGSGIPLASGVALGCKLKKTDQIAVCYFGDGASCTGAFHEGVTFAAAFDLPVLFVLVNNQYEESTHWTYWGGKLKNLAERAKGYGIQGISVDGNDAIAVAKAAKTIIPKIRKGKGPILLEAVTYRIHGHHMGDPGIGYRSKEEIISWQTENKEPIKRMFKYLKKSNLITKAEDEEIEKKLQQELDDAVKFAIESREIEPKNAFHNNVCDGLDDFSLSKI